MIPTIHLSFPLIEVRNNDDVKEEHEENIVDEADYREQFEAAILRAGEVPHLIRSSLDVIMISRSLKVYVIIRCHGERISTPIMSGNMVRNVTSHI